MSDPQASSAGAAWTPGSYSLPASAPEPVVETPSAAPRNAAPATGEMATDAARVSPEAGRGSEPVAAVVAPASLPPANTPVPAPTPTAQTLPPPLRPARIPVQSAPVGVAQPPPAPPPVNPRPPANAPQTVQLSPPPVVFNATTAGSRLEVVNREGWRKEFPLRRALAYVGSQPGSDIYLAQPDVAPRHIQFVPSPINRAGYRAINFSSAPLAVRLANGQMRSVPPRGAIEVTDGDAVELAGYALVFRSGEVQSAAIQARVDLDVARLELDKVLEGGLYIRNVGAKAGVQFDIQAQGFDARFVQIEPAPVLFPGAEKRVAFRIAHPRQPTPPAGDQTITFVVTAPGVYPGESAVVSATFVLAPFFAHSVSFMPIAPAMADYTLG